MITFLLWDSLLALQIHSIENGDFFHGNIKDLKKNGKIVQKEMTCLTLKRANEVIKGRLPLENYTLQTSRNYSNLLKNWTIWLYGSFFSPLWVSKLKWLPDFSFNYSQFKIKKIPNVHITYFDFINFCTRCGFSFFRISVLSCSPID